MIAYTLIYDVEDEFAVYEASGTVIDDEGTVVGHVGTVDNGDLHLAWYNPDLDRLAGAVGTSEYPWFSSRSEVDDLLAHLNGNNTALVIDYEDHDPAELQRAFCTVAREEAFDLAKAEDDDLGDLEMFYYDLDDDWHFALLAD